MPFRPLGALQSRFKRSSVRIKTSISRKPRTIGLKEKTRTSGDFSVFKISRFHASNFTSLITFYLWERRLLNVFIIVLRCFKIRKSIIGSVCFSKECYFPGISVNKRRIARNLYNIWCIQLFNC